MINRGNVKFPHLRPPLKSNCNALCPSKRLPKAVVPLKINGPETLSSAEPYEFLGKIT